MIRHLVLIGDMVDRGNNVVPLLWLIYKEAEAKLAEEMFILFWGITSVIYMEEQSLLIENIMVLIELWNVSK